LRRFNGWRTDGLSRHVDGVTLRNTGPHSEADTNGIGVFGYRFTKTTPTKLQVATMSDVVYNAIISTGEYPVSRPLYFYQSGACRCDPLACRNSHR
jgi:phosphate transport system substrate-binding protein